MILKRANVELIKRKSPFITATIAVVDTRTFAFTYAVAGHPPPVLFEPGRGARPLEFGSLPLAVLTATKYQTNHVQTVPGAMIVLYTDGVVEHSRDVTAGEALLCRAVETAANRPRGEAAEEIRESIFRSRPIVDDIAILTIRFWDPPLSLSSLAETSFRECPQGVEG
jgi:serine phosphatase RsbU (regulator of sigma subunit)